MKALRDVLRALRLVLTGGEVLRTEPGTHPVQAQVAGVAGETLDRVPIFGPFGLAYRPPDGSRVVTGAVGADRAQLVILGAAHADDPGPALEPGEVALYARGGAVLRLALDGRVHVQGDVVVHGDVLDRTGALDRLRQLFNAHVHPTPAGTSSPTTTPDV